MATVFRIWAIPALLACIGFAGLISALIGDGPWDIASWLCLTLLVAVGAKGLARRQNRQPRTTRS